MKKLIKENLKMTRISAGTMNIMYTGTIIYEWLDSII